MKLSLCIPLENQEAKLPSFFSVLHGEIDPQVEIVLCDNASSDQTEVLARSFVKNHPRVLFYKAPSRLSKDQLLKTTVELSNADFCWLVSPDQAFEPGNIQRILPHLSSEITGLSLSAPKLPFLTITEDQKYTNAKKCLGDLLLYLQWSSGHVFNRELFEKEYDKSSFAHTIAKMILKAPQWKYAHTPKISLAVEEEALKEAARQSIEMARVLFGDKSPTYFSILNRAYSQTEKTGEKFFPHSWTLPSYWTKLAKQTYRRFSRKGS